MTAAYANAVEQHNKTLDELAECERERDELKTWLEDQVCEAKDFAYKLEGKTVELATVTKERDELVAVCEQAAGAIEYLMERANDSDEMAYGTLKTTFVRDCIHDNLTAMRGVLEKK